MKARDFSVLFIVAHCSVLFAVSPVASNAWHVFDD